MKGEKGKGNGKGTEQGEIGSLRGQSKRKQEGKVGKEKGKGKEQGRKMEWGRER